MALEIKIDKRDKSPFYRQIVDGVVRQIENSKLKPGEKLPSERELAEQLQIARGTVQKAYEELERANIIDASRGQGSFIAVRDAAVPGSRQEEALKIIVDALDALENLKFSLREIKTFIDLKIIEREELRENLHIAVVDCNPETLPLYARQLGFIAPLKIVEYLLDDIKAVADPVRKLKDFAVILTTATHYGELCEMLPGCKSKIMPVVFAPSQNSIIEIARISGAQKVGVLCQSRRFFEIVAAKLANFRIPDAMISCRTDEKSGSLSDFLDALDVLVIPPHTALASDRHHAALFQNFTGRGGRIIVFEYQFDRGSLLYVQEKISELLNK